MSEMVENVYKKEINKLQKELREINEKVKEQENKQKM